MVPLDHGFDGAAEQEVAQLRAQIDAKQQCKDELWSQLITLAGTHAGSFSDHNTHDMAVVDVDVPSHIQRYLDLRRAAKQLQCITNVQDVVRKLERLRRDADRANNVQDMLDAVRQTFDLCRSARKQLSAVNNEFVAARADLRTLVSHIEERLAVCTSALRQTLERSMLDQLTAVHWPPSFKQGGPAAESPDHSMFSTSQHGFAGFDSLSASTKQVLIETMQVMTQLQMHSMSSLKAAADELQNSTDAIVAAPLLWTMASLCKPVSDKLHSMFCNGGPLDNPDAPEWLLTTIIKVTGQLAPHVAPLQPYLENCGLQMLHLPFEFVRAMHAVACTIVAEHYAPSTAAQEDSTAWLKLADELSQFDMKILQLQGFTVPTDDVSTAQSLLQDYAMAAIADTPQWRDAWLSAEVREALKVLDDAVCAEDAWEPSTSSRHGDTMAAAWQRTQLPSCSADKVMELVGDMAQRMLWLPPLWQEHCGTVAMAACIREYLDALTRNALRISNYPHDLLSPAWHADVLCACVCSARAAAQNATERLAEIRHSGGSKSAMLRHVAKDHGAQRSADDDLALKTSRQGLEELLDDMTQFATQWTEHVAAAVFEAFKTAVGLSPSYSSRRAAAIAAAAAVNKPLGTAVAAAIATVSNAAAVAAAKAAGGSVDGGTGKWGVLHIHAAAAVLDELLLHLSGRLDMVAFRMLQRALIKSIKQALMHAISHTIQLNQAAAEQLVAECESLKAVFSKYSRAAALQCDEFTQALRVLAMHDDYAVRAEAALLEEDSTAALQSMGLTMLSAADVAALLKRRRT